MMVWQQWCLAIWFLVTIAINIGMIGQTITVTSRTALFSFGSSIIMLLLLVSV
jgi:hypothetical protein